MAYPRLLLNFISTKKTDHQGVPWIFKQSLKLTFFFFLERLNDSIIKNNTIDDQINFFDTEATTPSSIKGYRKIKSDISTNQYAFIIGINQ